VKRKWQRGFTLLELMLVAAILGILAAVALPAYQDYTRRARLAEAFELARPVQLAVARYYDRWGTFPADNAAAGLPAPGWMRGMSVESIEVRNGVIMILLSQKVGAYEVSSKQAALQFRPGFPKDNPTGSLSWLCQNMDSPSERLEFLGAKLIAPVLPMKILPGSCR